MISGATRTVYFGIEHKEIVYVLMVLAVLLFAYGCWRRWRYVRGAAAGSAAQAGSGRKSVKTLLSQVLLHKRLLNKKAAGIAHLGIFWGMTILFVATVVTAFSYYVYPPLYKGLFYLVFVSCIVDLVGLFGVCGLVYMLVNRLVIRPDRLVTAKKCDVVTSGFLLVILVLGFVLEGLRIAVTGDPWAAWSPVGWLVSLPFAGVGQDALLLAYRVVWWVHMIIAFAWIAYLPFSRTGHLIMGSINIFLHEDAEKYDDIKPIDFDTAEKLGITNADDLETKGRLDLISCIECGRCQDVCPAYLSGSGLSPRSLILALRDGEPLDSTALWACTTCRACMDTCPMMIAHLPKLLGLRRYKSMEEAEMPEQLEAVTRNIETRMHPYKGAMASREEWCEGLEVPRIDDAGDVDILFWVGCSAAFDERNQKIAQAMVEIFNRTGTSFAIIGDVEGCCGDVARRIGSEYNFEMLARDNIDRLKQYSFKRIVTICPHCMHVLGGEYRQFGAEFEVMHHTQFIREAQLTAKAEFLGTTTYHDPCYLGRWNGKFDDARTVLCSPLEMADRREGSLCCGAGGGHAFMDDTGEVRISQIRVKEALATGAQTICTACPYCMQMLEDALKAEDEARVGVTVKDIAELVL